MMFTLFACAAPNTSVVSIPSMSTLSMSIPSITTKEESKEKSKEFNEEFKESKKSIKTAIATLTMLYTLTRDANKKENYATLCLAFATSLENNVYVTDKAKDYLFNQNFNYPFKYNDGTQITGITLNCENNKLYLSDDKKILTTKFPVVSSLTIAGYDHTIFTEVTCNIILPFNINTKNKDYMKTSIENISKRLEKTENTMSEQEFNELIEYIKEVNIITNTLIAINKAKADDQAVIEKNKNIKNKEAKTIAKKAAIKAAKDRAAEEAMNEQFMFDEVEIDEI